MKILFVTDYFYPHIGGVEKLFFTLARQLNSNGHKVTYITWRYSHQLPKTETIEGVRVIRMNSFSRFFFSLIALPVIIREARSSDLIHTSTYSSALGVRLASLLTGKKAVITVHEAWGSLWYELPFLSTFSRFLFRHLENFMLKLSFKKYITVSESTRDQLCALGVSREKTEVIHNGMENDFPEWKKPSGPFTFCYYGRAGISKGLDLLLPAFEAIYPKNPDIRLKLIVSPQSKRVFSFIKRKAESEPIKDAIRLMSNLSREQLLNELLSSHCVVIPSYSEGFGFIVAEASAMGIPVISSGRGSLPEVVYGKVITLKELSVNALSMAMEQALNDDFEQTEEKKYPLVKFLQKHLDLYKTVYDQLPS